MAECQQVSVSEMQAKETRIQARDGIAANTGGIWGNTDKQKGNRKRSVKALSSNKIRNVNENRGERESRTSS